MLAAATCSFPQDRQPLIPEAPAVLTNALVATWQFDRDAEAWPALNQAGVIVTNGLLHITATGDDPYVRIPVPAMKGPLTLRWRMRSDAQGPAEVFWTSAGIVQSVRVNAITDGHWHDYTATVPTTGTIESLRFDPATRPGTIDIEEASLTQFVLHPIQFERIEVAGLAVRAVLSNGSNITARATGSRPFEAVTLKAQSLSLTVWLHDPAASADFVAFGNSNVLVRAARDGTGARVLWKGQLVAIVCPLVEQAGGAVPLQRVKEADGVEFKGGPIQRFAIRVEGDEVIFNVESSEPVRTPVVRVLGGLEQGLLAGVEYLGKGEASSSTLDVERLERLRFEPDPLLLTMPLAAFVTERVSAALLWEWHGHPAHESGAGTHGLEARAIVQPVFSTPNRYDCTDDHFMALKGTNIVARLRLGDRAPIEDSILWAVRRRGLPELPKAPRTTSQQRALNLAALNGPLRGSNGWLHATWPGQKPQPFCDQASTIFRLTGQMPDLPALVPHGAHIENWTAYFVTGRVAEWLRMIKDRDATIMRQQQADYSFRYAGRYRRGHDEDTASGWCAQHAVQLLQDAQYTGDPQVLAAGVKALEYMKRFDTPRGAQTWEMPLHTPDLVAAAHLVRCYVLGYELTHRADYLDLARRWALSGVPFVYQWGRYPIQKYATIGVLGATDWTGVVWIGLPVQWCGTVYAYALTMLAEHDRTLDWRQIAEGILIAAEQMQWPDGPNVGCLPDSFNLADQRRLPAAVNPCVLVALRLRLDGKLDSLAVASDGKHRIVAPFPVTTKGGKATITARRGVAYEVLVDGTQIIPVSSQGTDVIDLAKITRTP